MAQQEDAGEKCKALITGASSGIGAAFAERLAHDGYDLTIVARRKQRLDELAEQLHAKYGSTVEVVVADLTVPDDLHRVEQHITSGQALALLINNAGFSGYMPFVQLPPDRAEELIRLHVVALTRLTRAALPAMVKQGQGAVINVSSLLSFSATLPAPPLPYRATYAGCKAYINTFTQLLAAELAGSGVQIQVLCPGIVQTEFHDPQYLERFRMNMGDNLNALLMGPEAIVAASLAGLQLGEVVCIPTLDDLSLLTESQEQQSRMMQYARKTTLAQRYTDVESKS